MEENLSSNVAVLAILDDQNSVYKPNLNLVSFTHSQPMIQEETNTTEISKQNIIWTKEATLALLTIYETKIHMLDNPKKKSKMWSAMAEDLKAYNIEVTSDQVRWKINALTKKYKDCIDNGQEATMTFKYFNEMHQILGCFNENSDTYRLASNITCSQGINKNKSFMSHKSSTPFRKLRAERRAKIELDQQWIEYLKRQEEQKEIREEKFERSLWLREEELQLRKKELEIKQTIALKKIQLKEKKHEEMIKIEREKCDLLRKLIESQKLIRQ